MKSKKLKKVIASLAAVSMLAGAVASPVSVSAQMLGYFDFEAGVGFPWELVDKGPASVDCNISNGSYNIEIINPGGRLAGGEDRCDLQLCHGGLNFESSSTYKLTYSVSSDTEGYIYSCISNYDGSEEIWHGNGKVSIKGGPADNIQGDDVKYDQSGLPLHICAGDTITVTAEFKPKQSMKNAKWSFQFGGSEEGFFPQGTKLSFSDLSLENATDPSYSINWERPYDYKDISVNQFGYLINAVKQATYAPSDGGDGIYRTTKNVKDPVKFSVMKDGKSVYDGTARGEEFYDPDSGNYVQIIDFSDFKQPGSGYTIKIGSEESYPFDIAEGYDLYKDLYKDAVNYFYLNRSGTEISEEYITSVKYDNQIKSASEKNAAGSGISKENLAHEPGHEQDNAYIQSYWQESYSSDGKNIEKTLTQDVSGGWYDGADYGKTVADKGIAVWTLMNIYEKSIYTGTQKLYGDGSLSIPEKNNGIPDILDEVKYEMDFFRKMICKDGQYKDMVYSGVKDFKWTGLAISPSESTALSLGEDKKAGTLYRIITPVSTGSTLNFAAAAAQFARLYFDYDAEYCIELLSEAEKAYKAALENDELFVPKPSDYNRTGKNYCDFDDEFYWAACELYLTTGNSSYLNDMKSNKYYLTINSAIDYFGDRCETGTASFDKSNVATLGSVSMLMSSEINKGLISGEMYESLLYNLRSAADDLYDIEEAQGYRVPLKCSVLREYNASGYPEFSNSLILNNGMIFGLAYTVSGDQKYLYGAEMAMDYIFGNNPNEISYVTGYGSNHTTFVFSQNWAAQIDPERFTLAPSGVLSSGPNSKLDDSVAIAAGCRAFQTAPQCCYVDNIRSSSTNITDINLNSSLVWMADFMLCNRDSDPTIIETYDEDEDATFLDSDKKYYKYGDLNNDNTVDITDLLLLSEYLMDPVSVPTIKNVRTGDVDGDGVIDIADLARFKQYISHDKAVCKLGPAK